MKGSRSRRAHWLIVLFAAVIITLVPNPAPARAQAGSQVRVVRLSFVDGNVTLYRPDAGQWAKVYVNTPIQQGFKLATGAKSFAEVEFKNGSTARLGQSSELDFTQLSLSPEGAKVNHLTLARGYATFALVLERGDVYRVSSAGSTFDASGKTMFRIDLNPSSQRLEVFKGRVRVRGPEGSGTVALNQVLEVIPGSTNPFQITNGITEDAWDRWVDKRQQVEMAASQKAAPSHAGLYAGSPFYGWSDLAYYGSWNYLPGYGSCWSPMMGAGWVPYSIGSWSWYPGFGYTWISGLPWGWLPFHYGSWIYPAGLGWCWMPGDFSMWSPSLVTWYQGPGWVSWSPRPSIRHYRKPPGFRRPARCPSGQNCSVAVSNKTFRGGGVITPTRVMRVNPLRGRRVRSPNLPLTRNLLLPGPASGRPPVSFVAGAAGRPGFRIHPIRTVAPTHIFSRGSIRGVRNVQPHAPAFFDLQTRRFVNRSGPALRFLREHGANPRFRLHGSARKSIASGVPAVRPGGVNNDVLLGGHSVHGRRGGVRALREPRKPHSRRRGFFGWFHSRKKASVRRESRRYRISHQRARRRPSARRPNPGFSGGWNVGRSSAQTGSGMRSGGFGATGGSGVGGGTRSPGMGGGARGGGMRAGGGGGSHNPHR